MKLFIIFLISILFTTAATMAGDLESDLEKALNQRDRNYYLYNNRDVDDLVPQIGTAGSTTITTQEERVFGEYFFKKARQLLDIIDDPVLDEYINTLGSKIVSHANNVHFPFNFFLIKDQTINAAAFLGGNVKVNSGLFNYADNESQIAAVLAHEITHVMRTSIVTPLLLRYSMSLIPSMTLRAILSSLVIMSLSPD